MDVRCRAAGEQGCECQVWFDLMAGSTGYRSASRHRLGCSRVPAETLRVHRLPRPPRVFPGLGQTSLSLHIQRRSLAFLALLLCSPEVDNEVTEWCTFCGPGCPACLLSTQPSTQTVPQLRSHHRWTVHMAGTYLRIPQAQPAG